MSPFQVATSISYPEVTYMRLKIVQAGEPVLRQPARALTAEEVTSAFIQTLIEMMRDTMRDTPGVGLAAPQVGVPLQLAVIEDRPEYSRDIPAATLSERERSPVPFHVIINPELRLVGDESAEFFEGCLSVAGFTALVHRPLNVQVQCLNERAESVSIEARGWYARILQHEIDHLNGTVYVDRMNGRSFMTLDNHRRYWAEKSVEELLNTFRT